MRPFGAPLVFLFLVACAAGPTPERVGFDYPDAGVRFRPRRRVVSKTLVGEVAPAGGQTYALLFPRTTSEIENPDRRLLTAGIVGQWNDNRWPLYDEISVSLFGAESRYSFELTEEREIELPWPGLESGTGTLRVFHMTPLEGSAGTTQYTFAVVVHHFGNAMEFCWREARDVAPDEEKIEDFFYWTRGLSFYEPRSGERH